MSRRRDGLRAMNGGQSDARKVEFKGTNRRTGGERAPEGHPNREQSLPSMVADVLALWSPRLGLEQTGNSRRALEGPAGRCRVSSLSPTIFGRRPSHVSNLLRPWATSTTTHSIPNDGNEFPRVSRARGIATLPVLDGRYIADRVAAGEGCFRMVRDYEKMELAEAGHWNAINLSNLTRYVLFLFLPFDPDGARNDRDLFHPRIVRDDRNLGWYS